MNALGASGRRILHVMTRFLDGGSERNVLHTMEWELAAGYQVELAIGAESSGRIPLAIPVTSVKSLVRDPHPVRDLLAVRELRFLIRRGRYDLVHTHQSKAGILGRMAASGFGGRVAHTVHMPSFGPGYNPAASLAFCVAERGCARVTDLTVFVGEELRRLYHDAGVGSADRSMVVRSPIGLDRFTAVRSWTPRQRREARGAFKLDTNAPVVLAIGALSRRKRFRALLRWLAPTLATTDLHLAIAGSGVERATLEDLAHRLGISPRVHFLDHVSKIEEALGACDLLVQTSLVEGVPQVVLQALAAGKAVVATECIGLREIPNAPIAVIPVSGAGMGDAVMRALSATQDPIEVEALAPWSATSIDASLCTFHGQLLG